MLLSKIYDFVKVIGRLNGKMENFWFSSFFQIFIFISIWITTMLFYLDEQFTQQNILLDSTVASVLLLNLLSLLQFRFHFQFPSYFSLLPTMQHTVSYHWDHLGAIKECRARQLPSLLSGWWKSQTHWVRKSWTHRNAKLTIIIKSHTACCVCSYFAWWC